MKGRVVAMIRFKLKTVDGDVEVALDSEQPNKVAPIDYRGHEKGVLQVKRWLFYEKGLLGQQIGDWCAPSDLKAAMQSANAKRFNPSLVEEVMGGARKSATGPSEG
jgi:hypothetical protein